MDLRATAASPELRSDPFTLGVASGDPWPDGFVIWTRLAPSPLDDDGLGGMPARRYEVGWQVARDQRFSDVVRAGVVQAGPETAHAVHEAARGPDRRVTFAPCRQRSSPTRPPCSPRTWRPRGRSRWCPCRS